MSNKNKEYIWFIKIRRKNNYKTLTLSNIHKSCYKINNYNTIFFINHMSLKFELKYYFSFNSFLLNDVNPNSTQLYYYVNVVVVKYQKQSKWWI